MQIPNGIWTFTRSVAGEAVTIKRPTAVRTAFDRLHNQASEVMILFIGQNGGYTDLTDLIRMHQQMISTSRERNIWCWAFRLERKASVQNMKSR